MLNHYVFVYLDDLTFFFNHAVNEHITHDRSGLKRLLENKLFVKDEIYEFHVSSFSFWGFIIEKGQKKLDPAKIRAVVLRFANFYRWFIKNYSCPSHSVNLNQEVVCLVTSS